MVFAKTPFPPWTGALVVRVCHTLEPVFDDPNLIAFGGLPAVMSLAEHALAADPGHVAALKRMTTGDQA